MGLTKHQEEVLTSCMKDIDNNSNIILKGSAGVGKTFLMEELIKRYNAKFHLNSVGKVYCTAPTHKAVSILESKVSVPGVEFYTIHSVLKMKRVISALTGKKTFEPSFNPKFPPLKDVGLLVVDESSMLTAGLLEFTLSHAELNNTVVVFIGDAKQLPPVEKLTAVEKRLILEGVNFSSPALFQDIPTHELTEIVRQKGSNPIIELSRDLEKIKTGVDSMNEEGDGYLFTSNFAKVIHELSLVNGTDELKYLAYTNEEVDEVNFLVRQCIYGNPSKVELNETLILNSSYGEEYKNNQEVKVKYLKVKEESFTPVFKGSSKEDSCKLKYYSMYPEGNSPEEIKIIHEDSQIILENAIKKHEVLCRKRIMTWKNHYTFVEKFASIKYNHAVTIHKSQGSTYNKVILNLSNTCLNRDKVEREKLLYTGITRTSKLLIVFNDTGQRGIS